MKKIIISILILLLSGISSFAQNYNVYKLENGQTLIVKEVKNNPIVIIDTWVKTGSINEEDKNNGVSHFLEHLFFKGTNNLAPGEFDKILESKGATTNAATSKDFTHYYVQIPSKHFDTALKLHADMLMNPLIPRKELEKERKVVMEEIAKDANNPDQKVYENLIKMLYTTHPYKRKVIGSNEVIGKITREEILDYYQAHYNPQNMVTVVIGDVNPDLVMQSVKSEFKKEFKKQKNKINKPEKQLMKQVTKTDYQPVKSGYLLIGYRGANINEKDTYALDVLSTILGDGRTSMLYQVLKEQKQVAYSVQASNASYKEDGIFMIDANFIPENTQKVTSSIFEIVENIRRHGVNQEQLNLAKNLIERDTYYSRESISSIATQIGYTTALTNNPQYYENYLNNIKKVSLNDIKRVAIKYLGKNRSAVSVVLPKNYEKQLTDSQIKKSHKAKLLKEKDLTQKYSIDNGIDLLITKNDLNDIVAISIYAKGGSLVEKIPGISDLTASVMMKGSKKYSSLDFAKQLEENGIKIMPQVGSDNFMINVLTTKNQLSKTFELLNEAINNANFDDYEIEKARTSKLNIIKKSRDIPLNIALEEYKSLIFEKSPYSYTGKIYEKTLPLIEREDIIDYYNKIFYPKNIIISVNGNVELSEIMEPLSSMFDDKKGEVLNYNDYRSKISSVKLKEIYKKTPNPKTAWIVMGWQVSGVVNEKESATLNVIDSLLGTGMSSRLFKNLRDAEGLAYQIGSSYAPKILKGAFTVYIGTNPKNVSVAKNMMQFEVDRLKYEFVSDKELQEAKDKILGKYLLSQETNLDKASYLSWFESSGRGFEFKDRYVDLINSITASDIVEVANKYFNSDKIISIVE